MPNSLKTMIKKLAHKGQISSEECNELITKLGGHDKQIIADAIDEFANNMICMMPGHRADILQVAEKLKE